MRNEIAWPHKDFHVHVTVHSNFAENMRKLAVAQIPISW